MRLRFTSVVSLLLLAVACARAPIVSRAQAMRKVSPPVLSDDLTLDAFFLGLEKVVQFLETHFSEKGFDFGEVHYSQNEYLESLRKLLLLRNQAKSNDDVFEYIQSAFEFFEVYGQRKWGDVLITTYFEPVIDGSMKKTDVFNTALYQAPKDLVSLDVGDFNPEFRADRKLRGRQLDHNFVPYFTRQEIDEGGALQGERLEICWVKPVDAFYMQIQGSGTVKLENGDVLYLNYAEKNGHRFRMEDLEKRVASNFPANFDPHVLAIQTYLGSLPKTELQSYLNMNPSYVFFRASKERAITFMGIPAIEGRTIATDEAFFSKGALGLISFDKPMQTTNAEGNKPSTVPVSRFVFDQDVGGVIKGPGRVDLFLGRGQEVLPFAFRGYGRLYYLAPKRAL